MLISFVYLLFGTSFNLQAQCDCDTIIGLSQPTFDASYLDPGSVICLQGGVRQSYLIISNINRNENDTIVTKIVNFCGKVIFENITGNTCFKIQNSKYFQLSGTGEPYVNYGIELFNTEKGILISGDTCKHFESDHINFKNLTTTGTSGIKYWTSQISDIINRDSLVLDSILIHHNNFSNIEKTAIVLGGPNATGNLYPALFNHVLVYNNIIDSTGSYGLYAKSASNMEIFNNKITNYSLLGSQVFSAIHIAEYSMSKCYNNFIKNGRSHGIAFYNSLPYQSDTVNWAYNNIIIDAGKNNNSSYGIYQRIDSTTYSEQINFYAINNTIIKSKSNPIGFSLYNKQLNEIIIANNIAVHEDDTVYDANQIDGNYTQLLDSGNIHVISSDLIEFADTIKANYRLMPTSIAIDSGLNLFNQSIISDFDGHPRPACGSFDVGAFEMYDPWPVFTDTMTHSFIISDSSALIFDEVNLQTGDYIGVFYQSSGTEKCAGSLLWKGKTDTLIAYGDSFGYAGFTPNDSVIWKVWNHKGISEQYNGVTIEKLIPDYDLNLNDSNTFADGATSRLAGLYQYQDIALRSSWNMVSTYIKANNNSCDSVFSEILENIMIVKDENENFFSPDSSNNTLDSIVVTEGYKIKTLAACTLRITGVACLPESNEVVADSGWSLIGYTRRTTDSIMYMMKPFIEDVDIVKNQDGYVYWPGYQVDQILIQQAGHGYEFNAKDDLSFYYPALYLKYNVFDSYQPKKLLQPNHFVVKEKTDNSMGLGIPLAAWDKIPEPGDEIGVFDAKGNLVGSTVFRNANLGITVWGHDKSSQQKRGLFNNENFTIRLFSASTGKEEKLMVEKWEQGDSQYSNNKLSIAEEITRVKEDRHLYNQLELYTPYPNPANKELTIPYFLPDESKVTIRLLSMQSKEILHINIGLLQRGTHSYSLNTSGIPSGIYIYSVETGQETSSGLINIVSF